MGEYLRRVSHETFTRHLQLSRPLIGQFILVHTVKLTFFCAYAVANLVLLKKQINLGLLILVILLEGLGMCKFHCSIPIVSDIHRSCFNEFFSLLFCVCVGYCYSIFLASRTRIVGPGQCSSGTIWQPLLPCSRLLKS